MKRVGAAFRAVWDFVVGDDWRTAAGVVVALGATALIARTISVAWLVMPIAVCGVLALSLRRASRPPPRA